MHLSNLLILDRRLKCRPTREEWRAEGGREARSGVADRV